MHHYDYDLQGESSYLNILQGLIFVAFLSGVHEGLRLTRETYGCIGKIRAIPTIIGKETAKIRMTLMPFG